MAEAAGIVRTEAGGGRGCTMVDASSSEVMRESEQERRVGFRLADSVRVEVELG